MRKGYLTGYRPFDDEHIRALVVAENPALRASVRTALESGPLVQVIAEVGDLRDLVRVTSTLCPDVVVLNPGPEGTFQDSIVGPLVEQCPKVHLLLLGQEQETDLSDWCTAVRTTTQALRTLRSALPATVTHGAILTEREREVLQLVADGLASKEIADKLSISVRTVESHRNQIMNKLNQRSVAALTKYAIREGLTAL